MIGRTNAGSSKSIALIRVLYFANTTCTCSNGVITYKSDTSGDYLFGIPIAGSWTVKGMDSGGTEKTVTVTVAKGDGKLVTLDTLIPPGYSELYQEAKHLRFYNSSDTRGNAYVPLGVVVAPGSWDFELEDLILDVPVTYDWEALYEDSGNLYLTINNLTEAKLRLTINSSELVANSTIAYGAPHNFKIHWSSIAEEAKPASLTVDNTELTYSPNARWLAGNGNLIVGSNSCWYGRYGQIKIKYNNTLLHHFIPCERRSDHLPGYFDLIDKTFKQGYTAGDGTTAAVRQYINAESLIGT